MKNKILVIIFAVIATFMLFTVVYADETNPLFESVTRTEADETLVFDESKFGDINKDGSRTASDARTLLRVSANLEELTEYIKMYGDYNKDNQITASDARMALRIAASLENIECVLHGHNLIEKIVAPTCTKQGYTTNKCSRCSYTDGAKENITSKIAHNYKLDSSVKATCKSEGYDLYKCNACGITKKENVQLKTAHSFKKGSVVKGTCISDGYTEYKCSICGAVEKRDVTKAGGHKYEYISKEPFETSDFFGYKSVKKCAYCNKKITTYDVRNGNSQIETQPIHSNVAKNIQEKFEHYNYPVEGYDITGKKVVIYGTMDGIDIDGYYYNLDGTLQGPCPHCGIVLGKGQNMCNGRCYLSWG